MDLDILLILAGVAFGAAFLDAIAGGGGLITLPALLLAGLEPVSAIATSKVQSFCGTVSATTTFARRGLIDWKVGRYLIVAGIVGGACGALSVASIDKQWLIASVPVLLILVAIYFASPPRLKGKEEIRARMSVFLYSFTVAPLLSFYDGLFGPGTGSFLIVSMVLLCALNLMHAMGLAKLTNAACNLGALLVFIWKGVIVWPIALSMAVAALIGAQLGAHAAVHVGPRLIRPMMVTVCCALAIKLLSEADNPLRLAVMKLFQ